MNGKKCRILGYQRCTVKETKEDMYRICMCVDSERENYIGEEALYIFLPIDTILEKNLNNYLNGSLKNAYYKSTDNIITGKTKVSELIFD